MPVEDAELLLNEEMLTGFLNKLRIIILIRTYS